MTDKAMFLAQRETQGVPRDVAEAQWEGREEMVELGPDGKEWAKTQAGYSYVGSRISDAFDGPFGPLWYGHVVREAFVAGAEWQEARAALTAAYPLMRGQDKEKQMFVDEHYALVDALQAVPEMPSGKVLHFLAEAAFYGKPVIDFTEIGFREQKRLGFEAVPPKAEYERAAGLWAIIRDALRTAARAAGPRRQPMTISERLRARCTCNIETSPCGAEDECRLDMDAADTIDELVAVVEEVSGWIDGWSPDFERDAEWPATLAKINDALARAHKGGE